MKTRSSTPSLLVALGLLAEAFCSGMWAASAPHVVVILTDDMGFGDPGCYNPDSRIPTPHIDKLAAEGMRFMDAHAAGPLCHSSRYGLMTGRYPFRTDVSRWKRHPLIEEEQVTIASMLADQGYQTAMVGKWHLGFDEQGYDRVLAGGPVDRGFDSFFGMRASTDIPPYFLIRGRRAIAPPTERIEANDSPGWSPIQGAFWREGGIAPGLDLAEVLGALTDEACKVIAERKQDRPLFLYLAYTAPHTPWLPSKAFAGKSGAGMYGDFLMMVDAELGRVVRAIDEAGLGDDTLVLFSSDNGPVWYPEDQSKFGHDAVGGLRGMKGDAWEGGHRMPFIIRWPGRVKAGSKSDQVICSTDLLATLAAINGVELDDGAGPDSFSFLSVLEGRQDEGAAVRGPIVMRSGSGATMIRSGKWKLIDQPGSGGFSKSPPVTPETPAGQLYDLKADRSEANNLYRDQPEVVARLKREMEVIVNSEQTRP